MSEITFNVAHRQEPIVYNRQSNTTSVSMVAANTNMYNAYTTGRIEGDGVSLTISDEAKEKLEDTYNMFMKMQEDANKIYNAKMDEQAGKSKAEALEAQLKNEAKAMEIARRIAKGGTVPSKDEHMLMDYSSEMYQMAKQAALFAKEHKKYKESLCEDEEEPQSVDENIENEKYDVIMEVPNEMIESGEVSIDVGTGGADE